MAMLTTETMNLFNPNSQSKAIQDLVTEIRNGDSNFSQFIDVFYNLIQSNVDPSFETIWVYTGLSSRVKKLENEDTLSRVTSVKSMFQLISACSSTCSSSKSIGLLAPLISEVYKLIIMLLSKDLCTNKEKLALKETKSLVNSMIGYLSLCSSNSLKQGNDEEVDLRDLASVWIDSNAELSSVFPLVSDEICKRINEEDLSLNYLAGVVLAEVLFLKLILESRGLSLRSDAEKDLTNWVVGSITGFRNPYFFDVLMNMLMEPKLPFDSHLQSSETAIVLRRVLYDAVVLVDYSFLITANIETDLARSLAISRLILTHEAVEFCRKNKDQKRVLSYSNAFSSSQLRLQITKWIKMMGGSDLGTGSSPKDLITEMVTTLEKQGEISFENALLKRRLNIAAIGDTQGNYLGKISMNTEENMVDSDLFTIAKEVVESGSDSDEDEKIDETTNAALISAARSMKAVENKEKKRKGKGNISDETRSVKNLKYDLTVAGEASDDDSDGDNDVEDSAV